MALTNQPYLPLYVGDWMNNNKLKMCSAAAHGIMISVMCILHKEATYGKLLLKQKFKQTDKQVLNFASQLAKLSAFDLLEIESPLTELINEGVLKIDGDYLICERMVRDFEISEKRAISGRAGGNSNKNKNFAYANNEAKNKATLKANKETNTKANTENESENENENENVIKGAAKNKRFIPPDYTKVYEYCLERNNGISAQEFVDFYQSKDWMIGKNKMKDWKAAIRTWERNKSNIKNEKTGYTFDLDRAIFSSGTSENT